MHTTQEIIQDIKAGKMVILMDDEDRENEGDLVIAAEKVTPEHINFMAQFGRGLICMPMTQEKCQKLNLPLMVQDNNQSKFGTNFTVSIEAATGVTTGISVHDRARTVQVAANAHAKPSDIAQPGHIFPIMAKPGGVLIRSGHTEASCDLASLAGLEPAAVICEILNEDGTMSRRPQLEEFAKLHDIKIGTIEDLIRFRFEQEHTIERLVQSQMETCWGAFDVHCFESLHDKKTHLALSMGQATKDPTLVRVQTYDPLFDLPGMVSSNRFGSPKWPLHQAMETIAKEGHGAVVLLCYSQAKELFIEEVGMLNNKVNLQSQDTPERRDWRDIGVGSQILSHLGYSKLKLLGSHKKFHGLSGFGLEVVEYLPYTERQS